MWNQQLEDRPGFDFIVKELCKIFEDCKRDENVLYEDFESIEQLVIIVFTI